MPWLRAGCGTWRRRARGPGLMAAFGHSELHVEVRVGWASRPRRGRGHSFSSLFCLSGRRVCVRRGRESMGKGGGTASTFWCEPRLQGDHCPFQKTETTALLQKWPPTPPRPPVHFRLPLPSLPSPTPAPGSSCPLRGGQQSSWELPPGSGEGGGAGRWWKLVLVQAKAGDFFAKGTFLFKIERAGFISQKRQVRDGRRGRLRLSLAG